VTRDLAREVAAVRVNLIVAALAVRLMTDTVVTGATFDVAASGS
jgi:hypothetical protein